MAETALARAGDRELRRRGAYWINVHGTNTGNTGTPDRICCYRGIYLGIEWKTARGRLSVKQRWHLDQIIKAGGIGVVARSVKDLSRLLDAIDAGIDDGLAIPLLP